MKNAAIDFLKLSSSGRAVEAFAKYVSADFKHHNPYFGSGATTLRDAMQENAKQNPQKSFEILHVLQDGDLVAAHSKVVFADQPMTIAVVHLFRFSGDKIVELWDIGQQVPEQMPNQHGMF